MSFIDGSSGVVKLDNVSGVLTDYSDSIESANMGFTGNAQQFYTLGSKFANTPDSKKAWSCDLTLFAETGAAGAYGMITDWVINNAIPGAKTLSIGVPDLTTSGSITYTGEVKCNSIPQMIQVNASGGQPQRATVQLMGDGDLVQAVVA